jgi:DNA polymerase-1
MDIFGVPLEINPPAYRLYSDTVVVDVEDNEQGGFVGLGVYSPKGSSVAYYTALNDNLKEWLGGLKLIGHNIKYDMHQLRKWGVPIRAEQAAHDTQIMSYCVDAAAESHSLKQLAPKLLGLKWPTYDEMTHVIERREHVKKTTSRLEEQPDGSVKAKRVKLLEPVITVTERRIKRTLDKAPVEEVAAYCASDCVATMRLLEHFQQTMTEEQRWLYENIELPTLRVLYKMECRGIRVDVAGLKRLDKEIGDRLYEIKEACGELNLASNKQLGEHLEGMGISLPSTKKGNKKVDKFTLLKHKKDPFIAQVLEFKQLQKLKTAFTEPLLSCPTLPRVHPTFNQVRASEGDESEGIRTGRLSCSAPNLQQVPGRTLLGKKVRALFIPDEGRVLVDADLGQIEPRLMAHFSQDPFLLDVFNSNKRLYEALIAGIPDLTRDDAKTFWLAWSYGAGIEKLSRIFKTSKWKGEALIKQLLGKMKGLVAWQEATFREALKVGGAKTMFGRFRRIPELYSDSFYEKEAGRRKAVNTPIQGTAADMMKLIMIALDKAGYPLQLVVHDEVLFSVPPDEADIILEDVERIMTSTVELSVPVSVEAHLGLTWLAAKGG